MQLYVFGGSFNPPHKGHRQLVEFILNHEKPDLLLVLPVSSAPHKDAQDFLPFAARLYLTRLQLRPLCQKHPNLKISRLENRLPVPNYTLRTVEKLLSCFPRAQITFVLGADAFSNLPKWHEPEKLAAIVNFLVLNRASELSLTVPETLQGKLRFKYCDNPLWDISSCLLREWLQDYYLASEQQDFYLQQWVASLLREKLGVEVFEAIIRHGWYHKTTAVL